MSEQRWSDRQIRKEVTDKMKEFQRKGALPSDAAVNAWPIFCSMMRDDYEAESANHQAALRQRDERIEALQADVSEWSDAWANRGATLQAFLAELTDFRHLLIEINIWFGNNPEWDLHLEPPWYKRLYEAIQGDPAACDEYAEMRKR